MESREIGEGRTDHATVALAKARLSPRTTANPRRRPVLGHRPSTSGCLAADLQIRPKSQRRRSLEELAR